MFICMELASCFFSLPVKLLLVHNAVDLDIPKLSYSLPVPTLGCTMGRVMLCLLCCLQMCRTDRLAAAICSVLFKYEPADMLKYCRIVAEHLSISCSTTFHKLKDSSG
jgi:hypothetical protein